MTVQEALNMAYDLMQMRGFVTGTVDSAKVVRTNAETLSLVNLWQNEVYKYATYRKSFEFNSTYPKGILLSGYDSVEIDVSSYTVEAAGSVKSYTLEVNMPCSVVIEDFNGVWNSLDLKTKTDDNVERFFGSFSPSVGATKSRIRIDTGYFGLLKNYALFSHNYYTVPEFRRFRKIDLPSDFRWEELIVEDSTFDYQQSQLERQGHSIVVDNEKDISCRLIYRPIPTNLTALSSYLPFDDDVNKTLPWFLAAQFCVFIDPITGNYFQQKYEEQKQAIIPPQIPHDIEDVYGNFDVI